MVVRRKRTPIFLYIATVALALAAGQSHSLTAPSTPTAVEMEGDALVRSLNPSDLPSGWELPAHTGHVLDFQMSEWNQYLLVGEENRAADYGITFSTADAGLDLTASLDAIDEMLESEIAVLNFTAVNPDESAARIAEVAESGIPVICATSWVEGCSTMVSANDYQAAYAVGVWAGNFVRESLGGEANLLDVGYPALPSTTDRSRGFLDGLTSILGEDAIDVRSVDGNALHDVAVTVATEALMEDPDVNVIFGINDDSALGALQAYEAAGLNLETLLVVGYGCHGNACKDMLREDGPFKVSAATFPEYQGRLLIDAGVAAFNDVDLPQHLVSPSVPMTASNVESYYTIEEENYTPNFTAISSIPILTPTPEAE